MWFQHQAPSFLSILHILKNLVSCNQVDRTKCASFSLSQGFWNVLRQSKVKPAYFGLTASFTQYVVFSTPPEQFIYSRKCFLHIRGKIKLHFFSAFSKHFILLIHVSKLLEIEAWKSPLAINVTVSLKEERTCKMFPRTVLLSTSFGKVSTQTWII